jgi:hypothetical protein
VTRESKLTLGAWATLPGAGICMVTVANAAEAGLNEDPRMISYGAVFRAERKRHVAKTTGIPSEVIVMEDGARRGALAPAVLVRSAKSGQRGDRGV